MNDLVVWILEKWGWFLICHSFYSMIWLSRYQGHKSERGRQEGMETVSLGGSWGRKLKGGRGRLGAEEAA